MLRSLFAAALAALFATPALAQNKLADPPITLRIGYLKGTTDLTLAKAHGSLEAIRLRSIAAALANICWSGR